MRVLNRGSQMPILLTIDLILLFASFIVSASFNFIVLGVASDEGR